jgi:hypothetical protein
MVIFKGVVMTVVKVTFSALIICLSYNLSFAKLMGEGEVTGQVVKSWLSDDRVIFRLSISGQRNEMGPKLGEGNDFAYTGPEKMEITPTDVIKLRYNSDDSYGIRVEKIEFIENKPGTVQPTNNALWMILPLAAALVALAVIMLMKRRRTQIKNKPGN